MAAYLVLAYDITDPEVYAQYNPGSLPVIMQTVTRHGGKALSAGSDGDWLAGDRQTLVVFEFPSVDAAHAWEDDPDYAAAKALRLASTGNRIEVIAPEFVMPTG